MALDPELGFAAFGRSAKETRIIEELYDKWEEQQNSVHAH